MAQQRKKKRRRNRHDPNRQQAAEQREEARRRAAEERRIEAESEERRSRFKKRLRSAALPVLGSVAVFAIGLTVFRSPPEVKDVFKTDAVTVMRVVGYADYTVPDEVAPPQCGVLSAAPSADATYSLLGHGAVILWHDPSDAATAASLTAATAAWEGFVAIAPLPEGTEVEAKVLATSFSRYKRYAAGDSEIDRFIEIYRERGASGLEADCPTGFTAAS
jgi:hypothetical protein